jgi:hypothetical protein
MDKNFLEFWGNLLLNAARGQKQLEDLGEWMHQGLKGFEDITALFRKIYGLEKSGELRPDYLELWNRAGEDFNKSYKDYLNLLGVVPREEYLALVKKYEELKEKAASQEETIQHLRMLLSDVKGAGYEKVTGQFDDLLKNQSEQFQKLMNNFERVFTKGSGAEDKQRDKK